MLWAFYPITSNNQRHLWPYFKIDIVWFCVFIAVLWGNVPLQVLLLTHLNFCHSEERQGKLSNGFGSVQREGVMTETVAGVPFSTFLPGPGLFNHFTSMLSCLSSFGQNASELLNMKEGSILSHFFFILLFNSFFFSTAPNHGPSFHKQMTGKRLLISSKPHAYPTFWNINRGSF